MNALIIVHAVLLPGSYDCDSMSDTQTCLLIIRSSDQLSLECCRPDFLKLKIDSTFPLAAYIKCCISAGLHALMNHLLQ